MTPVRMLRLPAALSAALLGVVGTAAPAAEVARGLRDPGRWVAMAGPDGAAAQLAASVIWCVCAWLTFVLALCLFANLPGIVGHGCRTAASALSPIALHRLLSAGIGVSLALSPAITSAASAASAAATPTGQGTAVTSHGGRAVALLASPAAPQRDVRSLDRAPSAPCRTPAPGPSDSGGYRVRPGDSLWTILRRRHPGATDARIARLLPTWYAANKDVVGPDPDQLAPGQLLRAPQRDSAENQR